MSTKSDCLNLGTVHFIFGGYMFITCTNEEALFITSKQLCDIPYIFLFVRCVYHYLHQLILGYNEYQKIKDSPEQLYERNYSAILQISEKNVFV